MPSLPEICADAEAALLAFAEVKRIPVEDRAMHAADLIASLFHLLDRWDLDHETVLGRAVHNYNDERYHAGAV